MWNTACPDWAERFMEGRALVPDFPQLHEEPFASEAARALRVFKRLRLPDVIGTPTMAEAAGPWFFPIVAALFGAYDVETNRRMIQELFLLVPKKNSKSSGAAMLMLTAILVNRRPEGEFSLIAPTKEIADIAFKQIAGAIRLDEALTKLLHHQRHIRTITHRTTGATLQVKAADEDVITGGKPVGTLIDETHVFATKSRAAAVFVELRGALAARPDGFMVQITTQSKDPPAGVFKAELENARDVRDGNLDLPLLPVLYELPDDLAQTEGAWMERRFWPLLNPNLGRSVDEGFLARELLKAERAGPEALALFASQHFNVEIGIGLRADRWRGADHWLAAADEEVTLDGILARCEVVVIGIDGGGLDDLLGLAVLGREKDTRRWMSWCHAWCFENVLKLRQDIAPKLRDLEAAGEVTIYAKVGDDLAELVEIAERVDASGLLAKVGLDPANTGLIVDALAEIGIGTDAEADYTRQTRVEGVSQGYKLMGAIKTAERKLADGTLVHADQPLMNWAVGNAKAEQKGNAVMITKQNAGTAKIDPLMALFDAVALMSMNPVSPHGAGIEVWEL